MINAVRHGDTSQKITVSVTLDSVENAVDIQVRSVLLSDGQQPASERRSSLRRLDYLTDHVCRQGGFVERTVQNGEFILRAHIPNLTNVLIKSDYQLSPDTMKHLSGRELE